MMQGGENLIPRTWKLSGKPVSHLFTGLFFACPPFVRRFLPLISTIFGGQLADS
jgi:hypothetical protein